MSTSPGVSAAPEVTLIVPCYNEAANIPVFYETARECYAQARVSLEIVFIDDGSVDKTNDYLRQIYEHSPQDRVTVQVVRFSRNFGKESGMFAGLQAARGEFECVIDADMQQDPALTIEMYNYLKQHPECDVVAAYQENRQDTWFRRKASGLFYKAFNRASDGVSIPENVSDFRMFRHAVGDALLSMPEYYRFSKAMFAWVGFNTHSIPYTPNERHSGQSKWSVRDLYKYAKGGLISFATWPLELARGVGSVFFIGAFLYLLYVVIVDYFILGIAIPGYATIVCLILLFGGANLFVLGVIGSYIGRDYIQNKHRPIYIAKEHLGAEEPGGLRWYGPPISAPERVRWAESLAAPVDPDALGANDAGGEGAGAEQHQESEPAQEGERELEPKIERELEPRADWEPAPRTKREFAPMAERELEPMVERGPAPIADREFAQSGDASSLPRRELKRDALPDPDVQPPHDDRFDGFSVVTFDMKHNAVRPAAPVVQRVSPPEPQPVHQAEPSLDKLPTLDPHSFGGGASEDPDASATQPIESPSVS